MDYQWIGIYLKTIIYYIIFWKNLYNYKYFA